jgi:hypothetical protein
VDKRTASGTVARSLQLAEKRRYIATVREARVAELAACGDLREHVQYVGTSGVGLKFSQRSARVMLAALTCYANKLLDELQEPPGRDDEPHGPPTEAMPARDPA